MLPVCDMSLSGVIPGGDAGPVWSDSVSWTDASSSSSTATTSQQTSTKTMEISSGDRLLGHVTTRLARHTSTHPRHGPQWPTIDAQWPTKGLGHTNSSGKTTERAELAGNRPTYVSPDTSVR